MSRQRELPMITLEDLAGESKPFCFNPKCPCNRYRFEGRKTLALEIDGQSWMVDRRQIWTRRRQPLTPETSAIAYVCSICIGMSELSEDMQSPMRYPGIKKADP